LEAELEIYNQEMATIHDENRVLAKRCDYLEKLVDDTRAMTREDSNSFQ
jgi:hypothetical protein